MKWSIRLKFLMVMCGLLLVCLGTYLFMAVTVFKADKMKLVFDLNRSQVTNLDSELETQFGGISEKLKLFALLPAAQQSQMVDALFGEGSDIVAVSIFDISTGKALKSFAQKKYLSIYGLSANYFDELPKAVPVPFSEILSHSQALWNASAKDGPPLIGYGRLVVMENASGAPMRQLAVVGFVKLDRLLQVVSSINFNKIFVANREGDVLVYPDGKYLLTHPNVKNTPIFKEALGSKTALSLVDHRTQHGWELAAFSRSFGDQLIVVATTSQSEVFRVVREFTVRTVLFALIVLTLVVLAAFLLSRSLTENIALLADRMTQVSKGDLSSPIQVRGRDETVTLAESFNQMIRDLKESHDALETMNRELDQKVKERTHELEEKNKKIKEVQETLIRTTRLASMGEIAGRTAHEVLNPLTILLTRLGVMQKRVLDLKTESAGLIDEIREGWQNDFASGGFDGLVTAFKKPSKLTPENNLFQEDLENLKKISGDLQAESDNLNKDISFIKVEGERIGKIINGMRRLGQSKSNVKVLSVHAVLADCCQLMADLFDQNGFQIRQDFGASRDLSLFDRDEMIQAVTNLMRNSLHALESAKEKGGPASTFAMTVRSRNEGGHLLIEIEDNGIGVPPSNQTRLFETTFTTKDPDVGTGLGLGISRRFVRAFGGDIEFVCSEPLIKTVFRICLPLSGSREKQGAVA